MEKTFTYAGLTLEVTETGTIYIRDEHSTNKESIIISPCQIETVMYALTCGLGMAYNRAVESAV